MRAPSLLRVPFASAVLLLTAAGPAFADDSASPGPEATVSTAGTSFLTATTVRPGQSADVSGSTGDHLYWSFAASAGQTDQVDVTVTLPPAANRHGAATWTADVFDGLRRRQACTAGPQSATAQTTDGSVSLHCTLRQVRSWAEPWSSDPLPGAYYVRLSSTALPEQDLGLPITVRLGVTAQNGAAEPAGASLKAPLSPPVRAGNTLAPEAMPSVSPSGAPSAADSAPRPVRRAESWFSWPSSRWWWTIGGGVLATITGIGGYTLTRHPRRWFSAR